MKRNFKTALMIMTVALPQVAKEQVAVKFAFDSNGVPQTSTTDANGNPISTSSQKSVIDDQGKVIPDETADAPVVSKSAQANYAAALAQALEALEAQVVAENYPNGDFVAFVEPAE